MFESMFKVPVNSFFLFWGGGGGAIFSWIGRVYCEYNVSCPRTQHRPRWDHNLGINV